MREHGGRQGEAVRRRIVRRFGSGLLPRVDERLCGHVELVKRILDKVGPDSPPAPFLAAGLELAGVKATTKQAIIEALRGR